MSSLRAGSCAHAARAAWTGDPRLPDDTHPLRIFQGQAATERDVEPRRVPFTEPARGRPLDLERTGVDADWAAGEAACVAQGRHDAPPLGRTDPPAQLPP